jgi:hypothetical protein
VHDRPGGPELRGRSAEQHRLERSLPPVAASVRLARMTVRVACRAWRVPDAGDPAVLLASELVTEALRSRSSGALVLRVLMTPRRMRIEVHDRSASLTGALPDGWQDECRRQLLDAESTRWGVEPTPAGTQAYAELALPAGTRLEGRRVMA